MAQKRKKPRSIALNLLLVAAVLAVVVVLIVLARSRDRSVELILPDDHEARQAKRTAPDNAYPVVQEAIALMHPRPKPVDFGSVDGGQRPWEEGEFRPLGKNGLAALCLMELPDDDPQVLEYIHGASPAADKAHEALAKPYFLFPEAREFRESRGEDDWLNLMRAMIALGSARFEAEPTRESLTPLLDAVRLVRLICSDENVMAWAVVVEGAAWQQLRRLGLDATHRPVLDAALAEVGLGYTPRSDVLRTMFRHIDDQLARQASSADMRPERRVFRGVFLYELQRIALVLREHRDELYQLADGTTLEIDKWLYKNARADRGPDDTSGAIRRINYTMRRALQLQSDYEATRIALALAAFHAEKGAYPAKLDELAPAYLAAVPADPYNGQPFGYSSTDPNVYLLYGPGYDAADNGGDPESDRIIEQVPAPK